MPIRQYFEPRPLHVIIDVQVQVGLVAHLIM